MMEEAFGRLSEIQRRNVNKQMFALAYGCITRSRGDPGILRKIVSEEGGSPDLTADLLRYCRLVESVM